MTDIKDRTPYKTREVWDALIKTVVYAKLAGDHKSKSQVFVAVRDVAKILDPEAFGETRYSKYWVINKMQKALVNLERNVLIKRRTEQIAIDNLVAEFMRENPAEEVEQWFREFMEECDG